MRKWRRRGVGVASALAAVWIGGSVLVGCTTYRGSSESWESLVPGRIVTIAAVDDPDRPRNVAQERAAGAAEATDLWETDSEISDWLPSPDGRSAMYRIVWHYVPKTEALVVRALTPGAPERYVVMGEPELGRLAGQVWSPKGDALAYGKQVGHVESFSGAGGTRRWEMRAVSLGPQGAEEADGAPAAPAAVGPASPGAVAAPSPATTFDAPPPLDGRVDDRRLFALDGALLGANAFMLVAWSPSRSRAVVLEAPASGGGPRALRVYDTTDGRLVARVAPGGDDARVAASPDGTRVAWLSTAAGVGTVDAVTGQWRVEQAVEADGAPIALAWSFDGRWLAWAARWGNGIDAAEGGAPAGRQHTSGSPVVLYALRPGAWRPRSTLRVASAMVDESGGDAHLEAIAPDGNVGLLTDVRFDGVPVLTALEFVRPRPNSVSNDMMAVLSEQVIAPGIWGVGWWPDGAGR